MKFFIAVGKGEDVEQAILTYRNSLPASMREAKARLPCDDWKDIKIYEVRFKRVRKGKKP